MSETIQDAEPVRLAQAGDAMIERNFDFLKDE